MGRNDSRGRSVGYFRPLDGGHGALGRRPLQGAGCEHESHGSTRSLQRWPSPYQLWNLGRLVTPRPLAISGLVLVTFVYSPLANRLLSPHRSCLHTRGNTMEILARRSGYGLSSMDGASQLRGRVANHSKESSCSIS